MTSDGSAQPPRRVDRAGIVIAALLAGLAAVLVWDARGLQSTSMYGMGPEAMPVVVAIGLALLAIGNLVDAVRGNLPPRESADPVPVLLILAGLALLIAIIGFSGQPPASRAGWRATTVSASTISTSSASSSPRISALISRDPRCQTWIGRSTRQCRRSSRISTKAQVK